MLDAARIAALLEPFVAGISTELATQLETYLELLLRWNARINLTAIREPEQIVTRHFGESLFAARVLREAGAFVPGSSLVDVGAGAGFPGVPIKLLSPELHLTLIESHNKKATFLSEVVRALGLSHTVVHYGRADTWDGSGTVVTLRAVENFAGILPIAAGLVADGGTLCLLIGQPQVSATSDSLGDGWRFADPAQIPLSNGRVVYLARKWQ